jgi:hypothetical protein
MGTVMRPPLRRDLRYAGVLDAELFASRAHTSWSRSFSAASRTRALMLSAAQARAYTMA